MLDKTTNQHVAEILRKAAEFQKEIGELSAAVTAQHLALCDLIPEFRDQYLYHMADSEILRAKHKDEENFRVLLEIADWLSKN